MITSPHRVIRVTDILGLTEVAEMCGVGRSTVSNWENRYADFPAPVRVLAGGPLWDRGEIARWHVRFKNGR